MVRHSNQESCMKAHSCLSCMVLSGSDDIMTHGDVNGGGECIRTSPIMAPDVEGTSNVSCVFARKLRAYANHVKRLK